MRSQQGGYAQCYQRDQFPFEFLHIDAEVSGAELFARMHVNYSVRAEHLRYGSSDWQKVMDLLAERHGERPRHFGEQSDFRMFRLVLQGGSFSPPHLDSVCSKLYVIVLEGSIGLLIFVELRMLEFGGRNWAEEKVKRSLGRVVKRVMQTLFNWPNCP